MTYNQNEEGEFEDPFLEASYNAYVNAETEKEALESLAFVAGVSSVEAVTNVANNAPEPIVRATLAGIFEGMLLKGDISTLLQILQAMGKASHDMGYRPGED